MLLALTLCSLPESAFAQDADPLCHVAPHNRLCADFPHDVPEFSEFFEYMVISGAAQRPFDRHGWQAFVALNWDGVGQGAQVTWRDFPRRDDVLGIDSAAQCGAAATQAEVIITDFRQSDGHALIDRAGNFIVYETRMNPTAARYITESGLLTIEGQRRTDVDFPRGESAAVPASVTLKTAWQILDAPSDDYITARGLIVVAPEDSITGTPLCIEVPLGLVGMHIVTKVDSGNGDEWIWATFEHRNNAPVAADARDINAIYGNDLFPEGCVAPHDALQTYLLNTGQGPANTPPGPVLWSPAPPHAVTETGPAPPTRVVRCWDIFAPTQATNARWQGLLQGTPLANYMLISTQWRGANASPYIEHGELPRFLSNTTLETYIQTDRDGTCIGCHAGATTAAGTFADATFILRRIPQ
ncbi:MAG: hypothetical protein Gyms2KO_12270 [Gymnodinialimonas sp.]